MTETIVENTSSVVAREALTSLQRDQMLHLLTAHFDGVSQRQFDADLAEKNIVILIHRDEKLVGFSTLAVYETRFEQEPLTIVYSGDTIVAPDAWRSTALFRAWIHSVKSLRTSFPNGPFYWLLLTSGFRTYRLLPLFWREFYPRFKNPTPSDTQRLLDTLARERFGARYDAAGGIVRFSEPQRLRRDLSEIPCGRNSNEHVAYFLLRNPGHANGDELVCLAELSDENLTPAGCRMIR